ncbi:MAG: T9SS type A sorting domain-containing protein [Bacteroidetes bacterium]|nr:T9SS type A sorting domain-containing protein [Bacteroidota bacterium]
MKNTRHYCFFICCLLSTANVFAQKWDNVWLMGYNYYPGLLAGLDFYWGYPDTTAFYSPYELDDTDASICDDDGNLLFYTNGVYVADRHHQQMEGSEGFNLDSIVTMLGVNYLPMSQCAIILPYPDHPGQYFLFHLSGRLFNGYNDLQPFRLDYSIVDMSENNGAGKMVAKNENLVQDTLLYGTLQAVQHGNGRDWWIVVGAYNESKFYRMLLTPAGIQSVDKLSWGVHFHSGFTGQSAFSPDGNKFAIAYPDSNLVSVWSFDRCDGTLTLDASFHPEKAAESDDAYGCGFSPNSRYLYVSSYLRLHQYDTWVADLPASGIAVGEWDGFIDFIYPVSFGRQQLGPDGKIYISSVAPAQSLNFIAKPNLPGLACEVHQHTPSLSYLTYNSGNTLPNFPHFRTGPSIGSGCDSLGLPSATVDRAVAPLSFSIAPNPTDGVFQIVFENAPVDKIRLEVFSTDGHLLLTDTCSSELLKTMDVSALPSGIYFVKITGKEGGIMKKLVVVK